MGRLLDDLQRKMTHKAEQGERDPLKILVHSTHDTALAGLCTTLDVFDERYISLIQYSWNFNFDHSTGGPASPPQ